MSLAGLVGTGARPKSHQSCVKHSWLDSAGGAEVFFRLSFLKIEERVYFIERTNDDDVTECAVNCTSSSTLRTLHN